MMSLHILRVLLLAAVSGVCQPTLAQLPSKPESGKCNAGNCQDGIGEKLYTDNSRFIGLFSKGLRVQGTYIYPNGDFYLGPFVANQRSGNGYYQHHNGEYFEGLYEGDKRKFGTYFYQNGNRYEGEWEENLPHGYGRLSFPKGNYWEGVFVQGKRASGAMVDISLSTPKIELDSQGLDTETSKSLSAAHRPRIFAVVVGLSNYQDSRLNLQYSSKDAGIFVEYLKKAMPIEVSTGSVTLLQNEQATANNIREAMGRVFSTATSQDLILFYFSGHGDKGKFIPYDFPAYLNHSEIRDMLNKTNAAYRICIADACFSGSMLDSTSTQHAKRFSDFSDSRLAVMMSSRNMETSIETSAFQQGVFTYYIIKGLQGLADLNGDAYITALELFIYTRFKTAGYTKGEQVPVVFGRDMQKIPLAKLKK